MTPRENILAHRLGIARSALKAIAFHRRGQWDNDTEVIGSLKYNAEAALRKMRVVPGRKKRRRERLNQKCKQKSANAGSPEKKATGPAENL